MDSEDGVTPEHLQLPQTLDQLAPLRVLHLVRAGMALRQILMTAVIPSSAEVRRPLQVPGSSPVTLPNTRALVLDQESRDRMQATSSRVNGKYGRTVSHDNMGHLLVHASLTVSDTQNLITILYSLLTVCNEFSLLSFGLIKVLCFVCL